MVISLAAAAVVLIIAAFVYLFRKWSQRTAAPVVDATWLESFSLSDYAPMQRLLDPADFEYLAAQPGYRPKIGKQLLAERQKIFVEYLGLLSSDFNRLIAIGRVMVLESPEDQFDFSQALERRQLTFFAGRLALRIQVALLPFGAPAPDVADLLHALERIRAQVQQIALARMEHA